MSDPGRVTIEAFGHRFENVFTELADDLRNLEEEGATYAEFVDRNGDGDFLGTLTRYRIKFKPAEIFEYVEAHIAKDEFDREMKRTEDFTAAVLAISNPKYQRRVTEYGDYGRSRLSDGTIFDNRGCLASFIGPELEELVCGWAKDRYEAMPRLDSTSNQDELVLNALKSVAVSARHLTTRSHNRTPFEVENEYDIQDLTETALRSVFVDVVREEWTPKRAGSAKRIDLTVPSIGAVIECKYVRSKSHANSVADELRIDFECYHDYEPCRQLFAYVFDPNNYIADHEQFSRDLSGIRRKRDHEFSVIVLVS